MSSIVKLKNVSFSNRNLQQLSLFYSDGLIGAWRFKNSEASLVPVAASRAIAAVPQGTLSFTANGVITDTRNNIVTDVSEEASMTFLAVYRVYSAADDTILTGNLSISVLGNYCQASSIVSQWPDEPNAANLGTVGCGMWGTVYRSQASASDPWLFNGTISMATNTPAKRASDDASAATSVNVNITASHALTSQSLSTYRFAALVINGENEVFTNYLPKTGHTYQRAVSAAGQSFYNRYRMARATMHIGGFNDLTWGGRGGTYTIPKLEIVEVVMYSKALSLSEVDYQYSLSKKYLKKYNNIDI